MSLRSIVRRARGEAPGPRRLFGIGVAVTVLLGSAGFVLGHASGVLRVHVGAGDAVLSNDTRGSLSLVNGPSGRADAEIPLTGGQGHQLVVNQQGTTVLVQDTTTGRIERIDLSGLTVGATVDVPQGTVVVSGPTATYLIDAGAQTASRIDPATLRTVAGPFRLGGRPGRAAVDGQGTLWVPDIDAGTVVPIGAAGPGTPLRVAHGGDDLVMTIAGGAPVVVDGTTRQVIALSGTGTAGPAVALPPDPAAAPGSVSLLVPSACDPGTVPIIQTAPDGPSLELVDLTRGATRTVPLPSQVGGHQLGPPVEANGRVVIPDDTDGTATVYDTATGATAQITVTGAPGPVQAEVVDGIVYLNDPNRNSAVVVTPDGQIHNVTKTGPGVPNAAEQPSAAPPIASSPQPTSRAPAGPGPATSGPPADGPTPPRFPAGPAAVPPADSVRPAPPAAAPTPAAGTPTPSVAAVAPAPLAPVGVSATPGAGYVDVSWQPPASGGTVTGYQVLVSPAGGTQTRLSDTSVRVTGLTCATSYGFAVASLGVSGRQVASAPVYARPCLTPSAPGHLTATPVAGYTRDVTLSWSAPPGTVGAVSYLVSWSGGAQQTTATSVKVGQLLPGHTYTFTVAAEDDAGTGTAATAQAVPGSRDTKTVTIDVSSDTDYASCSSSAADSCRALIRSSYTSSAVAWYAPQGHSYTAYCAYGGGPTMHDDDGDESSSTWVYLTNGSTFGWANTLWLNNGSSVGNSLLNCRTPLVPVP